MALEQAGISLQAEGFAQYIKRLDEINKKQQEIFNVTSQKTGKTVDEIAKSYKAFEKQLKQNSNAQRKAQQEAKQLAAAQKTAAATQRQAFISTGQVVAAFVKQTAQAAFELGKLGAQFQGSQVGLNNLAGSFGQSGKDIQRAIQEASRGALSGLAAIQAANQGLLLGVAKTPEEFASLTKSALTLGRTLGLDATQSIEQFTSALGRQSTLILDNFGIAAKDVNAEIERLAQADFGKARSELTEAQKQAIFMEAALNLAAESAAKIGDEAGEAQAAFDRLTSSSQDFKTELGVALSDLNKSLGITDTITKEIVQATEAIRVLRGGSADATVDAQIEATEIKIKNLQATLEATRSGLQEGGGLFGTGLFEDFLSSLDEAAIKSQEVTLAELQMELDQLNFQKAAEDAKNFNDQLEDTPPIVEDSTDAIEAYQSALQQAEQLQLSFSRSAEDSALRLARANEDIARRQGRQVSKLQERQAKDRDKLLKNQVKRLDEFEKSRRGQISEAEADIAKARKEADDKRKSDQQKLQRDLQREQERFNLSRLQSERRFSLQDRRLRAEGDVLALQELRENRDLERQEEKENFEQGKKEQVQSAKEQQREQTKDLESQVSELKTSLENRRAELLASFDEQLEAQRQAQIEAKLSQQQSFEERAEDRAIQLQREEEDRRISQGRQLEDLGRSLADQQDVTEEGAQAVAGELEKVFGIEGTADNIISGFAAKTKSEFTALFDELEEIIKNADMEIESRGDNLGVGFGIPGSRLGGVQEFDDGGVVTGPGPIGSPVPVMAHVGETFLPTHQQSFQMNAPVIPSQNLNVNMSGGFDIRGGEAAGEVATRQAVTEMTDAFEIVVKRLGRQI